VVLVRQWREPAGQGSPSAAISEKGSRAEPKRRPASASGAPREAYTSRGQLLGDSVHAAGTVYGGTELLVAALWALRGFNRPTDIDKQTRLIAKGAHRAAGNGKRACVLQVTARHCCCCLGRGPVFFLFGAPALRKKEKDVSARRTTQSSGRYNRKGIPPPIGSQE
jgi:hypothetical protein